MGTPTTLETDLLEAADRVDCRDQKCHPNCSARVLAARLRARAEHVRRMLNTWTPIDESDSQEQQIVGRTLLRVAGPLPGDPTGGPTIPERPGE